jgi:hypothetical protein
MVAKSKPALPSSIQKVLETISKKAPVPRSPPVGDYLKALYRRWRVWKKSKQLNAVNKSLRDHAKASFHPKMGKDHFRIMIELTSPRSSNETKSKYLNILAHARGQGFSTKKFAEFYKKRGSVNKCVDFIRKQSPKSKKRRIVSVHAKNLRKPIVSSPLIVPNRRERGGR